MEQAPAYEFRTTCVKPFVDKAIMSDIGEMIEGAYLYVLQQCSMNVKVLNPEFFGGQNPCFLDDELHVSKAECPGLCSKCTIRNA